MYLLRLGMTLLDMTITVPVRATYVVPIYVELMTVFSLGGQADRSLSPHAVSLELLVTLREVDEGFDKAHEFYDAWYDEGPSKKDIQHEYEDALARTAKVKFVDAKSAKEYRQQSSRHLALCGASSSGL